MLMSRFLTSLAFTSGIANQVSRDCRYRHHRSISLTILNRIVNQVQYPSFLGIIMPMLVNLTNIISLRIWDRLIKFRVIADIDTTSRYH
jgi:hypothetical protein